MSDLDAIRDRIDILDLVGETVRLQRAGKIYKGLCPFHTEKTPSFTVSPDRRTWHCFGACATGGDVFSFLMRRDKLDFAESVRLLAARAGIDLGGRGQRQDPATPRLMAANEAAAGFFHHVLLNSAEAEAARRYAQSRGLGAEAIRDFELGFAPDSWDALSNRLGEQGFLEDELVNAGLLVEGERGRHDRFRRRLMFPIRDNNGKVRGFGGRALDDATPKYLNSPQTPVFDKSSLLYGLDRAKEAIRQADLAVLVEGYLDVITAHQHGYTNVVASMGTALNERHILSLKRYAHSLALALDADEAGIEATLRSEQLIREMHDGERVEVVVDWGNLVRVQSRAPLEVRIFSVPAGKDPDESIRSDPENWPAWVAAALPPFEFRLRVEMSRLDRANPRERIELLNRMAPLLAEVSDRTLQAHYVSQLATAIGVREDDIRRRLNATLPPSRRGTAVLPREPVARVDAAPISATARTELFCLALLLRCPQLRDQGLKLPAEWFTTTAKRQLFELWCGGAELDDASVPEELREEWAAAQNVRLVPAVLVDPDAALDDCLLRLQVRRIEDEKRLLTAVLSDQDSVDAEGDAINMAAGEDELTARILADMEAGRNLHRLEYRIRTGRDLPAHAPAGEDTVPDSSGLHSQSP
jgi:DNA primase